MDLADFDDACNEVCHFAPRLALPCRVQERDILPKISSMSAAATSAHAAKLSSRLRAPAGCTSSAALELDSPPTEAPANAPAKDLDDEDSPGEDCAALLSREEQETTPAETLPIKAGPPASAPLPSALRWAPRLRLNRGWAPWLRLNRGGKELRHDLDVGSDDEEAKMDDLEMSGGEGARGGDGEDEEISTGDESVSRSAEGSLSSKPTASRPLLDKLSASFEPPPPAATADTSPLKDGKKEALLPHPPHRVLPRGAADSPLFVSCSSLHHLGAAPPAPAPAPAPSAGGPEPSHPPLSHPPPSSQSSWAAGRGAAGP